MNIGQQDTGFFAFPTAEQVETKAILKQLNLASRALAQLQGSYQSIPNPAILINTLPLQEAKNSSEIESIVTTQDALFKTNIDKHPYNANTKEVKAYSDTLLTGFKNVRQTQLLTLNHIQNIYRDLEKNDGGFRNDGGETVLKDGNGNIIYTPPQ
ncbi:MAG: Fic family protein, partial [Alphaproteobacteria bacterium]|nr:Fic family protein [Alphaproteobacteria bacterium]